MTLHLNPRWGLPHSSALGAAGADTTCQPTEELQIDPIPHTTVDLGLTPHLTPWRICMEPIPHTMMELGLTPQLTLCGVGTDSTPDPT